MKRFITCLLLVTAAALFYVYQEVEAVKVGYMIRKQEETKTLYLDRARALKYNIARLKAPNNMERRLLNARIVLQAPKSWQTLVISPSTVKQPNAATSFLSRPPLFSRLLVGTAQAEAKES
jgi:hypothetical protein